MPADGDRRAVGDRALEGGLAERPGRRCHWPTSTRIARASSPPSTCTSIAEAHEQRTVERLLVDHLELVAGRDPALGQEPQHLRIGVGHAGERPARADLERLQAVRRALLDRQVAGRDRIAVRVVGGVAELGRDQLLELLGQDVLEHLGLLVDAVPRDAEDLDQVQLEQPVVAHHLERHAPPVVGQRHAAVGLDARPGRARRAA